MSHASGGGLKFCSSVNRPMQAGWTPAISRCSMPVGLRCSASRSLTTWFTASARAGDADAGSATRLHVYCMHAELVDGQVRRAGAQLQPASSECDWARQGSQIARIDVSVDSFPSAMHAVRHGVLLSPSMMLWSAWASCSPSNRVAAAAVRNAPSSAATSLQSRLLLASLSAMRTAVDPVTLSAGARATGRLADASRALPVMLPLQSVRFGTGGFGLLAAGPLSLLPLAPVALFRVAAKQADIPCSCTARANIFGV